MSGIADFFYLDATGIHTPDLDTVYNWLSNEYKAIYGQDVVLDADTQDGQWVGIIAQALHDTMNVTALVYRSFSPSTAMADALDTNVRINGIARKGATYSMCDVDIVGNVGTEIHNGSVKDTLNRVWNLPELVTIPLEGKITVTARASEPGAWSSLPDTINVINTPTRGWLSVTNPNEGTAGAPVETDADLRRRQQKSVALPAQSVLEGMIAGVAGVSGVTRYRAYENDTNTYDVYGIPAHSTSMVVEGGDAEEIARQIHKHKTVGSGTYGDTTVAVTDSYGLVTNIKFQRPSYVRVKVEVHIKPLQGYTNAYLPDLKARVLQYVNNLGIGEALYIARLIPPILACNTSNTDTFDIISVQAGREDGELSSTNISVEFNEALLTSEDLITVVEDGAQNAKRRI